MPTIANRTQYEDWNGEAGLTWLEHDERFARMAAEGTTALLAAAGVEADDQVLDVGCGTGRSTLRAAALAPRGYVTGVDLSAPMLARARELAVAEGRTNVGFEQADAQVHPFPTGRLDVVISQAGTMFFDDPVAAFRNLGDAMVPGGRIALLCHRTPEERVQRIFEAAAEHLPMPDLAQTAPGVADLADPDHARGLLGEAGFRKVSIDPVSYASPLGTDVEDAARFLFRTHLRSWLELAAADAAIRAEAAVRTALAPLETSDGVVLPAAGWLITARWP